MPLNASYRYGSPRSRRPGGSRRRVFGTSLERYVAVIDELAVLLFGRLRPAQKIHRLGDDLGAVTVHAIAVGPFRVVDAAADQHLHALLAILLDRLAEPVEGGDAVPFGVLDPVAVLVPDNPAFRVAGARGGQGEVGDAGAALGDAGFGSLTDVAGENDDVLHFSVSVAPRRDHSLRRDPAKAVGSPLQLAARRQLAPKAPVGAGSRACAATRPGAAGVAGGNRTVLGDQSVGGIGAFREHNGDAHRTIVLPGNGVRQASRETALPCVRTSPVFSGHNAPPVGRQAGT